VPCPAAIHRSAPIRRFGVLVDLGDVQVESRGGRFPSDATPDLLEGIVSPTGVPERIMVLIYPFQVTSYMLSLGHATVSIDNRTTGRASIFPSDDTTRFGAC
jgi:hypothetical protein